MLGGISIWQLLIVLGIIILVFGTKNCVTLAPTWAVRSKASRKPCTTKKKQRR